MDTRIPEYQEISCFGGGDYFKLKRFFPWKSILSFVDVV